MSQKPNYYWWNRGYEDSRLGKLKVASSFFYPISHMSYQLGWDAYQENKAKERGAK